MDTSALLETARHLARVGRYTDAIAEYDRILAADPDNTSALEQKGEVYYMVITATGLFASPEW